MANKYTNSGTLGRNKNKTQDNHPEYSGSAEIDGRAYWLSAWIKKGPDGNKFFSISFKPKDQQQSSGGSRPAQNSRQQPDDDDTPF